MDFIKNVLVLLLIYVNNANCFNLDTSIPIVKQGPSNSKFGFSLTQSLFKLPEGNINKLKLFVGAPTDNNGQANIWNSRHMNTTGSLYDCPYTYHQNDCKVVPFGRDSWAAEIKNDQTRFSNMFYGGSMAASDHLLMVCGYKFIDNVGNSGRWARGYCQQFEYVGGEENQEEEDFYMTPANPCDNLPYASRGHTEYGMSQCGYALDVDQLSVLYGAPGSNNWRGAMFKEYVGESDELDEVLLHTATDIQDSNEVITEKVPVDFFSYLGSSVAFGNIFANKGRSTYIAGAPRAKGYGKVLLFEKEKTKPKNDRYLTLRHSLIGDQFGARFGDSVLSVDLNGDNKDDLIVGAPYYHENRVGGAVFIYYSNQNGILFNTPNVTLKSRTMDKDTCQRLNCEHAKFGYSLAAVGDLDHDNYQDIAIGAPYEGNGAMYIYRGSKDGIIEIASQRISADDLSSSIDNNFQPVKSFGFSISKSVDVDENGYNDIAVGAYKSNQIAILRGRPIVDVIAKWQFFPKILDPSKGCMSDNNVLPCTKINVCFNKTSMKGKPIFRGNVKLQYTLHIKKSSRFARMQFQNMDYEEDLVNIIDISSGEVCFNHNAYVTKSNKDFLNPIDFKLTYTLDPKMKKPRINKRSILPDLNNYPILNEAMNFHEFPVQYQKNCGDDNTCNSNLLLGITLDKQAVLEAKNTYSLRVTDKQSLNINVKVENYGEDAHEATYFTVLPKGISYVGMNISGSNHKVSCYPTQENVTCYLGNPMPEGSQPIDFTLLLSASKLLPNKNYLDIDMHLNTTSEIVNKDTTKIKLRIRFIIELDLQIKGYPEVNEGVVYYSGEINNRDHFKNEVDMGSIVEHTYEVTNKGPGNIGNIDISIMWPTYVSQYGNRADIFYLMEIPAMLNNKGRCHYPDGKVNNLNLQRIFSSTRYSDAELRARTAIASAAASTDFSKETTSKTPATSNYEKIKENTETSNSRQRREVRSERATGSNTRKNTDIHGLSYVTLSCEDGTASCKKIMCEVIDMEINRTVTIVLKSRMRNSTFLRYYQSLDYVKVESNAELHFDNTLAISDPSIINNQAKGITTIKADARVQKKKSIPWWIILLAILGGLFLLLIMILIMWKCGFFKRQSVDEMQSHSVTVEKKRTLQESQES